MELLLVQLHALLLHHLQCQVDGEAVGVVELEGVGAGEGLLPLGLVLGEHVVENTQAAVDGLGEVLLLHPDDLGNVVLALPQLGVYKGSSSSTVHSCRMAWSAVAALDGSLAARKTWNSSWKRFSLR